MSVGEIASDNAGAPGFSASRLDTAYSNLPLVTEPPAVGGLRCAIDKDTGVVKS